MTVRGHVDGMEGGYVVGWAATPNKGNCTITIQDAGGALLAKGRASRHRPDLATLGLGRTTLAFRIAVPRAGEPRILHIFGDDQELLGSPIVTGAGQFDGFCTLEGDTIAGWATERTADAAPPVITVLNHQGIEVGRGASQPAPDANDPLFTPAHFAVTLNDQCFGAGEQILRVLANGVEIGTARCNFALAGNIEVISAGRCQGWLTSPDVARRTFEILAYRDGVLAGCGVCEHEREDVRGIYPDCGPAGFDIQLDRPTHDVNEAVTLSLRFAGSDRELFSGPYVVASRPAAVASVYNAARLGQLGLPGIGAAERAVLAQALTDYLAKVRSEDGFILARQPESGLAPLARPRLAIIIPIYRGVEVTQACIESVLAHRDMAAHQLILINDASPETGMAGMLATYAARENVLLLTNAENLGFVRTVNRGLALAQGMDVVLLNSDTVVYAGGFAELIRVADTHPDVGTVTAISNNATVFSYPHAELRHPSLNDVSWHELAEIALAENAGQCVNVPTGHGFCMFIKAEVIRRIGYLDEGFGRGYGEENDFCARAAALGYRNVAAGGVLVEHKESISFENERASLLARNLPRLNKLYPEYTPLIVEFERLDGLRQLRWALDRARLERARTAGTRFTLVVSNALEGGTAKAITDIESYIGYGGTETLTLRVTTGGVLELEAQNPLLRASFLPQETTALFAVLDAADPEAVLAHQLLGFPAPFLSAFKRWQKSRHSVFWAHDFYTLCPRVTMIDAIGRFCGGADAGTCARCVEMGGAHETSSLTELTPAQHRALFAELLGGFTHVLTPSANAAGYLSRIFPEVDIEAVAHPEPGADVAMAARKGSDDEIVLLGAIGAHKGSQKLLEIAQRARLTHPHLHFRVFGYTDIDKALKAVGNVSITGKYKPEELPRLLAGTKGRLALFLSTWPETYSYTLSEAAKHGFIPLVPDIGALADRVRAAEYGVVFPFPAGAEAVLNLIDQIASGAVQPVSPGATPARLFPGEHVFTRLAEILGVSAPAQAGELAAEVETTPA